MTNESASTALARLGEEYWQYRNEVSPTGTLLRGDHRYDDRMEDLSREAEDAEIARLRSFADDAEAIDPAALSAEERLSRLILMHEARASADDLETRAAEIAVNHTIGLQAMVPVMVSQFPLTEPEHATAIVDKFHAMGRAFRQIADRIGEGVAAGHTPPHHTVERTILQLDEFIGAPVDGHPYLGVKAPPAFTPEQERGWREKLADAFTESIRPALVALRDRLQDEVLPVARPNDRVGIGFVPGGEEIYRTAIRVRTTLDLDPQEIHQIGLDQVAALADEYRELGGKVLGTDDVTETFHRLRDDPDLHYADGPAIIADSVRAMDRARAEMGGWFGRLPKADCTVEEVTSGPTAFYYPPAEDGSRPGTFFVNTADPARWSTFEIEAMAFHEGIPGHHLQLAIAQELEEVPEFRKHARFTAYSEGWGLYTERLADEMGLYSSQLARIGMLSNDSMRAVRLVVDTGMHALGWSREQAIDYALANSPMSLGTIEGEIDRYIGWPGQALAYMIGRLEIMKIRARAEATLGAAFDIRGFHDTVLEHGALPLPVLADVVAEWAGT